MQSGKKYIGLVLDNLDIVINNIIFGLGFALLIWGIILFNSASLNSADNQADSQQVNTEFNQEADQEASLQTNKQLSLQETGENDLQINTDESQHDNQEADKTETGTNPESQVTIGELDTSNLRLEYNHLYPVDEEIELTIPTGSSGSTVAKIFDSSGIMSEEEFRKYLNLFNIENRIKAGRYTFNKNDSFADILNRILIRK